MDKSKSGVGGLDRIDIIFTFGQTEYIRAVRQYLLAGNIVRKRDFFILPLIFIFLFSAMFYSHFNTWVLLLTLICLAAVLLLCYLFFFKPWYDYDTKPHLRAETLLSFTENAMIWPATEWQGPPEEENWPLTAEEEGSPEGQESGPLAAEEAEDKGGREEETAGDEGETAGEEGEAAGAEDEAEGGEGPEGQISKESPRPEGGWGGINKPETYSAERAVFKPREKRIKWDAVAEVWENREFFFLVQQPHRYHIVPKRSFANQDEMQYFLKMLYRRVGIVEVVAPYPSGS